MIATETLVFEHIHTHTPHASARHTHSINTGGSHTHGPQEPSEPEEEFKIGDYVEFPGCMGPLYQIERGEEPFWGLKHVAGPQMPAKDHKACFNANPPEMKYVIELVIAPVNEMKVLAIFASEEPK